MILTQREKYLNYKKRVDLISFVLIFLSITIICLTPTSFAGIGDSLKTIVNFFKSLTGGSKDVSGFKEVLTWAFSCPMYMPIAVTSGVDVTTGQTNTNAQALQNLMKNIVGGDTGDVSSSIIYSGLSTGVALLKTLAAFMLIIIAMGRLFQNLNKGQDGIQSIYKMVAEIGVTGFIMMNIDTIVATITAIGVVILSKFTVNSPSTIDTVVNSIGSSMGVNTENWTIDGPFYIEASLILKMIVPIATSALCFISAGLATLQTLIELAVRRVLAPFAVIDIYEEGLRSPGVRYLKKYFATLLKMLIIILIANMTPAIISSLSISDGNFFINALVMGVINLSAGAMMLKADSIANDVVG